MAHPFGATSVASYIAWAAQNGCQCQSGYGGPNGSPFVKITAPSGKYVFVVANQREYMTSTALSRCDQRLGMSSPFERV